MKTLKKSWPIKLLILSSTILISVTPVKAQMTPKTERIERGVPASFTGLLIPEYQFREMNEDILERDYLKERLKEIPKCEEPNTLQHFLFGFLAGSLAVVAINKLGSK